MPYLAHICGMSVELRASKVIKRRKPSGTPELLFPKQLFDAVWGTEEAIPVEIVFESGSRIIIKRKNYGGDN
jgi:hypothetical protein